jgi:hypothetical protein
MDEIVYNLQAKRAFNSAIHTNKPITSTTHQPIYCDVHCHSPRDDDAWSSVCCAGCLDICRHRSCRLHLQSIHDNAVAFSIESEITFSFAAAKFLAKASKVRLTILQ